LFFLYYKFIVQSNSGGIANDHKKGQTTKSQPTPNKSRPFFTSQFFFFQNQKPKTQQQQKKKWRQQQTRNSRRF
jgi:hypothetical protein